ncbi:hypothetical protein [Aquitalea magnusonii]|nr:hypothetical protein [Aquitalea magnusonii]
MKDEKLSELMDGFLASAPAAIITDDSIAVPADGAEVTARLVVTMLSDGQFKTGIYGDEAALRACSEALLAHMQPHTRREAVPC